MSTFKEDIKDMAEEMIRDRLTPGVVLLVSSGNEIICCETIGTTQYQDQGTKPVTRDIIYDIASITKAITATAVLMLLDRDVISLDDRLARFFPASAYGEKVAIRHLLTHTSGIAIQMSKLGALKERTSIRQAILQASLESVPGDKVMFTNVNSYLLGQVVESMSGMPLDQFFRKEIFAPLGMKSTTFKPSVHLLSRIAPTEIVEGRGMIHGEVHDESAYALGGTAGHAGLFSTADDLHRFCRLWLPEGTYDNHCFFSKSLAQEAVKSQVPAGAPGTGFGWMLNREWMGQLGPLSFGHTAFTGPSIMVTPRHHLVFIFLTNRTYPHRGNADRHHQARMIDLLSAKFGQTGLGE